MTVENYEERLEKMKGADKEQLKEMIFWANQESSARLKEVENTLADILQNMFYLNNLLINALKEDDEK